MQKKLKMDDVFKIKNTTCFIVYNDIKYIETSKMVEDLQKKYSCFFHSIECVEKQIIDHVFENVFPSYMVVQNGELKELGMIVS